MTSPPPPRRLWADEFPDACQDLLDPTIQVSSAPDDPRSGLTELPAGWVPIVNELHRDIVGEAGAYVLATAGQKGRGLRYEVVGAAGPAIRGLIAAAVDRSRTTCSVCGQLGEPSNPPRRASHPRRATPVVFVRPPAWPLRPAD